MCRMTLRTVFKAISAGLPIYFADNLVCQLCLYQFQLGRCFCWLIFCFSIVTCQNFGYSEWMLKRLLVK